MRTKYPILLIEDDLLDVEVVNRAINSIYPPMFELVHAPRFSDAVELVRKRSFNVIILDLGLPNGGGLRNAETLIELVPQTPLIVLTGQNDEDIAMQAIELGVQEFLDKAVVTSQSIIRSIGYAAKRMQRFQNQAAGESEPGNTPALAALADRTTTSIRGRIEALRKTTLSDEQLRLVCEISDVTEELSRKANNLSGESKSDSEPVD